MEITTSQAKALKKLLDWYKKSKSSYITLGGYAGTGKTTLISLFSHEIRKHKKDIKIAYCAFTGKASQVMNQKLSALSGIAKHDFSGTIHSLIYKPLLNKDEEIIGWEKNNSKDIKYDLIIIDEASMITSNIWNDLLSYKIPIIAVGDHGQLPPINERFNLMQKPHLVLSEIVRQKKDNPIITLSELARKTGEIPFGQFGSNIMKLNRYDPENADTIQDLLANYNENTLVLSGFNHTRILLNQEIRKTKGIESAKPVIGDKIICLKNNYKLQIFNGLTGTILSILENTTPSNLELINMKVEFEDNRSTYITAPILQFNSQNLLKGKDLKGIDLFDFGYALTVHKAQGSQAETVILFEERSKFMDLEEWKRWLYTAITRASTNLVIIK